MNNYNGNGENLNNLNNLYSGEYTPVDGNNLSNVHTWNGLNNSSYVDGSNSGNSTYTGNNYSDSNYVGHNGNGYSGNNIYSGEYGVVSNDSMSNNMNTDMSYSSNDNNFSVNEDSDILNNNDNVNNSKNNKKATDKKVDNKKKKGTGYVLKKGVAIAASAAIFGGIAGGVFNIVTDGKLSAAVKDQNAAVSEEVTEATTEQNFVLGQENGTTEAVVTTSVDNKGNMDVSDIAESVMPSVVSITIKGIAEANQGFFGRSYQYETEGSGSGIIIGKNEKELLIITNNHVVEGATTVSVAFVDDEVYSAKVKGTNVDSDLAVIVVSLDELSENTLSSIQIAKIGDSDKLKVGEQVVAIGNALGYGQSVTTGIVSAKDRTNDTNNTPLIQTDAAINPGNSGGALLNMNGELVGINSSKYASYDVEGMGYAISISAVEDIINDLSNRETRDKVDESEKGYIGISYETITEAVAESQGVPIGILIRDVADNSAASKAGIEKYDIITKFDGQSITTSNDLVDLIQYYKVGEKVKVTLYRLENGDYVEKEVEVTLGKR